MQSFAGATRLDALNSTDVESSSSVTADGLTLYFVSNRSSMSVVYRSTRSDLVQPFTAPVALPELGTSTADVSVTADNSAIYLSTSIANGDILRYDRVCD